MCFQYSEELDMNILLSNDDGWRADGLRALEAALDGLGRLTLVAPDRNRSAASNSLTIETPVRVVERDGHRYAINGTPTDCVHLAVSGLLEDTQHLVVSGINDGANLGDDVLYSGTVAAAMEGRFLGRSSIAMSLVHDGGSQRHFDTAGRVARELVQRLIAEPLAAVSLLNVNVPNLPYEALQGIEVTRLGVRHRAQPVVRDRDPRGRPVYWVGAPGEGQDAGPGTDFYAVEHGRVSVTPLQFDLTLHSALAGLRTWVSRADV
jgi:5'-nucleotidase